MTKNIQMPISFFFDVVDLVAYLNNEPINNRFISYLCASIRSHISQKIDAIDRRKAFSKYKNAAPGSLERELMRREYLVLANIHKDWIAQVEMPF